MKAKRKRSRLLEVVRTMPGLTHDCHPLPFDIRESMVARWLVRQPDVMQWIFDTARSRRLIAFDTGFWRGVPANRRPARRGEDTE